MFCRTPVLPSDPLTLTLTMIPATRLISGPLPKELVTLGREVLQLSARKQRRGASAQCDRPRHGARPSRHEDHIGRRAVLRPPRARRPRCAGQLGWAPRCSSRASSGPGS